MRFSAKIVDHILQHRALCLQDIDLLLMLDQSVHNYCILRGEMMFVFMDFGNHREF
jgi:hypothetical protein